MNALFALALGICIVALTVATAYFYSTEGFAVAPDFKSKLFFPTTYESIPLKDNAL
jgi:hypothetical protein